MGRLWRREAAATLRRLPRKNRRFGGAGERLVKQHRLNTQIKVLFVSLACSLHFAQRTRVVHCKPLDEYIAMEIPSEFKLLIYSLRAHFLICNLVFFFGLHALTFLLLSSFFSLCNEPILLVPQWSAEEKERCLEETGSAFKYGGLIMQAITN